MDAAQSKQSWGFGCPGSPTLLAPMPRQLPARGAPCSLQPGHPAPGLSTWGLPSTPPSHFRGTPDWGPRGSSALEGDCLCFLLVS